MASTTKDGEYITLTRQDTRVLVALLLGPANAYQLARRCEQDADIGKGDLSISSVQYSLKSLQSSGYVIKINVSVSRSGHAYKITATGEMVLTWELGRLKKLLKLADARRR